MPRALIRHFLGFSFTLFQKKAQQNFLKQVTLIFDNINSIGFAVQKDQTKSGKLKTHASISFNYVDMVHYPND